MRSVGPVRSSRERERASWERTFIGSLVVAQLKVQRKRSKKSVPSWSTTAGPEATMLPGTEVSVSSTPTSAWWLYCDLSEHSSITRAKSQRSSLATAQMLCATSTRAMMNDAVSNSALREETRAAEATSAAVTRFMTNTGNESSVQGSATKLGRSKAASNKAQRGQRRGSEAFGCSWWGNGTVLESIRVPPRSCGSWLGRFVPCCSTTSSCCWCSRAGGGWAASG